MIRSFYQRVSFLRLLVWLLPLLVPAVLFAQVKPDVTGIVLDPQGEKIPGVTVRAIQASGGKPVFQMTDEKGWFHFDNLGAHITGCSTGHAIPLCHGVGYTHW